MAVTIGLVELADAIECEPAHQENLRLHAAAVAIVDRYAAGAPEAISNEAAIRVAGYLRGDDPGVRSLLTIKVGEIEIEPRAVGSALRLSGAMSLLGPYRTRRAS